MPRKRRKRAEHYPIKRIDVLLSYWVVQLMAPDPHNKEMTQRKVREVLISNLNNLANNFRRIREGEILDENDREFALGVARLILDQENPDLGAAEQAILAHAKNLTVLHRSSWDEHLKGLVDAPITETDPELSKTARNLINRQRELWRSEN
jgi:hypothetical protein